MNKEKIMQTAIVAAMVAIGISVGMVIAPVRAQSTFANVGFVDVEKALAAHPNIENVKAQIKASQDAKMAELSQYQTMGDLTAEQRQQLMDDLYRIQSEVEAERTRLTNPLIDDIVNATGDVGAEAGVEIILDSAAVMWGGLDLTPLIIQRIQ